MSRFNSYVSILPDFASEEDLQVYLDKSLTEASDAGDTDMVIDLLQKGACVDGDAWNQSLLYDGENFMTPLMNAAMKGHHKILKLLLENDAKVNKGDRYNITPLHCAALSGHGLCVSMLIQAGANVNAATFDYDRIGVHQKPHRAGTSPLQLAARQNRPECIKKLLQEGNANINQTNVLGLTALNIASQNGHEESVMALINHRKNNLLMCGTSQVTADTTLHHCVRHGMIKASKELLTLGMDVNKRNASGYTPLHFAVIQDRVPHSEMVRVLIEYGQGIDVNALIGDGRTGSRSRKGRSLQALHLVAFASPEVSHNHELHTMQYRLSREFVVHVDPSRPSRDVESASLLIQYGAETSICYNNRTLLQQEVFTQTDRDLLDLLIHANLFVEIPEKPVDISDEQMNVSKARRKLDWMKELSRTPPLLQHCCRCKIRKLLQLRLNRINELPIPHKLQDYLLLKF